MWCLIEEVEPSGIVNFLPQVRSGLAGSTLHLQIAVNLLVSSFFSFKAKPISQIVPLLFLSFLSAMLRLRLWILIPEVVDVDLLTN